MPTTQTIPYPETTGTFYKETLIKGQPARVECIDLLGQTYAVNRGPVTIVSLEDEWYEDVADPTAVVESLRAHPHVHADLFTFWQRLPNTEPMYQFHTEWEHIAVLPTTDHSQWFNNQIKSRLRTSIRKAEKEGLVVRETEYDDAFVRGMTAIFNESAVRQGRRFWHYGKDVETVRSQFSRYIHRECMIGAYYEGEMIGFVMLGDAGCFGLTGQIISSLKHRDKATNLALMSATVQACAARGFKYLVYLFWSDDSLSEFKRRCGFEKTAIPRFYVPLTWKGKLALKTGAHRGLKAMVPERIKVPLKQLRRSWYERQPE